MTDTEDLKWTLSHFLWRHEEPKHNESYKWSLCSRPGPLIFRPFWHVSKAKWSWIVDIPSLLTSELPHKNSSHTRFLHSACWQQQRADREDDSFSVRWFNYTNCGTLFKFRLSSNVPKLRHVCKYWSEQHCEKCKSKVQQSGLLVSNRSQTPHGWNAATLGEYHWYSATPSPPCFSQKPPHLFSLLPPAVLCSQLTIPVALQHQKHNF